MRTPRVDALGCQLEVVRLEGVRVGNDETTFTSRSVPGDPLAADATSAVAAHFASPQALWKLTNNQTLPVAAALGTPTDLENALTGRRDPAWQPLVPEPVLTVTTMPTVSGEVAVSVSRPGLTARARTRTGVVGAK